MYHNYANDIVLGAANLTVVEFSLKGSGDMFAKIPALVSQDPDFEAGVFSSFLTHPIKYKGFRPAAFIKGKK